MPADDALLTVLLTPPGRGGIATVLVQGPGAADVVAGQVVLRGGRPLAETAPGRPRLAHFGSPEGEEVIVCVRAPGAVELHCHGGHAAAERIQSTLAASGCRVVPWQEWVCQAESDPIAAAARIALADARSERTAAILLDQYQGALRREMDAIAAELHGGDKQSARRRIDALLARADVGLHLTRPWRVALAGPPNAGKSSLINALVGFRRAIVDPLPGTTRDAVSARTAVDGWPVELCDTAGLRSTDDPLERLGVERAEETIRGADLVVLVFDSSQPWSGNDQRLVESQPAALLVHNKCDLPAHTGPRPAGLSACALAADGATEGAPRGIDELLAAIARRLVPDSPLPGAAVPFTTEQVAWLRAWRVETDVRNGR